MSPEELTHIWESIQTLPQGQFAGRQIVRASSESPIWAAVDSNRTPHFLIRVSGKEGAVRDSSTRGVKVFTDDLRIGEESPAPFLALVCHNPRFQETFAALCHDLLENLQSGESPVHLVTATLRRWREFFQIPSPPLTLEQCLGLFAELWFLERWIGIPDGISDWNGPSGARHDFQRPESSIEVKATIALSGGAVHRISSLDQLEDPAAGALYLFSLRATVDSLSANTLPGIVNRIMRNLRNNPEALTEFSDRLGMSGYKPGDANHYDHRWRILAEELFEVRDDFPRLTTHMSSDWPAGVVEVSYGISVEACARWRVATRPEESPL